MNNSNYAVKPSVENGNDPGYDEWDHENEDDDDGSSGGGGNNDDDDDDDSGPTLAEIIAAKTGNFNNNAGILPSTSSEFQELENWSYFMQYQGQVFGYESVSSNTLKKGGSFLLDIAPVAGNVKSLTETITGVDLVTGRELTTSDRVIAGIGIIVGGIGKELLKVGRSLLKIGKIDNVSKGAASQTTNLYRVMSEGEYNSLVKSGQFTQYDKAMESKWFATNAKDAAEWGKKFYPNGNYKMVEIEVPKDSLSQMYNVNKLDNIGPAYNAERDFINSVIKSIKDVTR